MLALSTCWNSHRHSEGMDIAKEARELGFQWIEISHGTKISLLPGLLKAVEEGVIRVSSLHNFCPSPVEVLMDAPDVYEFTSNKKVERDRAVSLTRKTIEMAARFHARRVVLHLGSVKMRGMTAKLEEMATNGGLFSRAYVDIKLELVRRRQESAQPALMRVREVLRELLPLCEKHQVMLGLETRSHFEQIPTADELVTLLEEFKDSPWIGAWHDFGHVQRQANLALLDHSLTLSSLSPRLAGCHIHDVKWPARDHRVPFTGGSVDFAQLMSLVPKDIPWVWELNSKQQHEDIVSMRARWVELFGE